MSDYILERAVRQSLSLEEMNFLTKISLSPHPGSDVRPQVSS